MSDDVVARLAPCASTQVNESFNALVSTKCPKSRHYSGSSSIFYRVAAAVCQKNEGYNYLCKISRRLGITRRGVLKKYASIRDNKIRKDKLRKASKTFKRTRLVKRISSLMHEEGKTAKEGKTYESNMGVAGEVTTAESNKFTVIRKKCEEDVRESLIPLCRQDIAEFEHAVEHELGKMKPSLYMHRQEYSSRRLLYIMYDFETTSLSHKTCEVIQIAASTVDEEHKFSCYILPESNIHEEAFNVTGLRITTVEGKRELTKNGIVLRTLQSHSAFKELTEFVLRTGQLYNYSNVIAHNGETYDMSILLRYLLSNSEARKSLEDATSLFVDSKRLVQKKYSQEKPAKKISKS